MLPLLSQDALTRIAPLRERYPGMNIETLSIVAEMQDAHAAVMTELNRIQLGFLALEAHFMEMLHYAQSTPHQAKAKPQRPRRRKAGMGRRHGAA